MASKQDWIGVWADSEFFRPFVVRAILTLGGFWVFPTQEGKSEPDYESMMNSIDKVHGFYVSGRRVNKDIQQGIWLSRSSGDKGFDLMIPWHFVRMLIMGSAKHVQKFGFELPKRDSACE